MRTEAGASLYNTRLAAIDTEIYFRRCRQQHTSILRYVCLPLCAHGGPVTLNTPTGVPAFRTRVLYVPQRPSLLPGTPRDFLDAVSKFAAHKPRHGHAAPDLSAPFDVAAAWGIDAELWDRNWSNLSGGESQRIALATAVGLRTAEVLLLDGMQL